MPWIAPFRPVDAGAALHAANRTRSRIAAAVEAASGQSLALARDPASMTPPDLPLYDRRRGDRRRTERRRKQDAIMLDTRCDTDRRSGRDRRQGDAAPAGPARRFDDYA